MVTSHRRLVAAVVAAGMLAVPARNGFTQVPRLQQCYHIKEVEPDGACSICANTCMGTGWKCCFIISN
jgi:hypothetical protein